MAINNPIIDSGPTVSRAEAKMVVGRITDVIPPLPYRAISPLYPIGETRTQYPQREGELAFVESADRRGVTPYVVVIVNISSTVTDGGNFTSGVTWAENNTVYDGGSFSHSTSSSQNNLYLNGGNFSSAATWAEDNNLYDGGDFGYGTSLAQNSINADGGNFSSGVTLAGNNALYDGGNFSYGDSSAQGSSAKLVWKRVTSSAEFVDPRTGRPKDPLQGFY